MRLPLMKPTIPLPAPTAGSPAVTAAPRGRECAKSGDRPARPPHSKSLRTLPGLVRLICPPTPSAAGSRKVWRTARHCAVISALLLAPALATAVAAAAPGTTAAVRLTPSATLSGSPGLDFYKIETPTAAYYLEKFGAGLAAMIDPDGHDWISFRSEPGSRSAGEFRGFPNAVHQQAGNYFHPRNTSTEETKTTVERVTADYVSIAVISGNGLWAGRYEFFPSHCTFTMTRMPPENKYWILYEGTPGGKYDDTDWWMTSAVKEPQPLTTNHEGDIPAPEWIVFGDRSLNRVLFVLNHGDDDKPDRFYQMDKEMTVFGFGRLRAAKYLDAVPRQFSIGFLETTRHEEIGRAMERILKRPE
jgi:hypothetical protein